MTTNNAHFTKGTNLRPAQSKTFWSAEMQESNYAMQDFHADQILPVFGKGARANFQGTFLACI